MPPEIEASTNKELREAMRILSRGSDEPLDEATIRMIRFKRAAERMNMLKMLDDRLLKGRGDPESVDMRGVTGEEWA
jgi:hypothetical protein